MSYDGKVPFGRDGSLIGYVDSWVERNGVEWRENTPFQADLFLEGHYRGRSAAGFRWSDKAGREFPMFMKDVVELLQNASVVLGRASGPWIVCKRGKNYGIKRA